VIDTLIRAVVIGISVQVGRQLVTGRHSAPGWYFDPWRQHAWRYWDGGAWTGWIARQ
jgi:hypothetical protein